MPAPGTYSSRSTTSLALVVGRVRVTSGRPCHCTPGLLECTLLMLLITDGIEPCAREDERTAPDLNAYPLPAVEHAADAVEAAGLELGGRDQILQAPCVPDLPQVRAHHEQVLPGAL